MTPIQLKDPAEEIFKLPGVLSVTVGRLDDDLRSFHYCYEEKPEHPKSPFDHTCQKLQGAAIKMLANNGLACTTVVLANHRIIVARWRELACAVTTEKADNVNKSIWRKVWSVGRKYDRKNPDDTRLGKALGELERSNPEVAKAADSYDRMTDRVTSE